MRKLCILISMAVMVALLFCATVASAADGYDLGKALGIGNEATLVLDTEVKAARPFDASYSVENNIVSL
ncbi:MAG: hypothetical protein ABIG95_02745 [Candidatus Woesearchaeota archaeon]